MKLFSPRVAKHVRPLKRFHAAQYVILKYENVLQLHCSSLSVSFFTTKNLDQTMNQELTLSLK